MTSRVSRTALIRFRPIACHHCSSVSSTNAPTGGPPALFTKMSMRPNRSAATRTKCSTSSALVMSAGIASTSLPSSAAAASTAWRFRPQIATCAPSATNAAATALPSPRLAAATRAVWPCRPRSIRLSSSCVLLFLGLAVLAIRGSSSSTGGKAPQTFGELPQAAADQEICRALGIRAVGTRSPRRHPCEDLHPVVHRVHGVDVELARAHGLDHFRPQHHVGHVLGWDHYPLPSGEPEGFAHRVVAFNLLVDPTDGLDLPLLIDGPGDGDALVDRHSRQLGQQRVQLRGAGAIPLYLAVGLLEGQRRVQAERPILRVLAPEVPGQDRHTLAVNAPRHLRLAFDVHDPPAAHKRPGRD